MLIIEIALTVWAWKYYKAAALLPIAACMGLGFLIGSTMPATATEQDLYSLIWLDILAVVALGIMIAAGKAKVTQPTEVAGDPNYLEVKSEERDEKVTDSTVFTD